VVLQDHRPPNFAINLPAMTLTQEDTSVPIFEIDQTETYGRYLISNPLEILLNLRALAKQRTIITLYLDDGSQFFLSSIVTVDEEKGLIFLDASNQPALNQLAVKAQQATLSAILDRVKIQIRLPALNTSFIEGKLAFSSPLPSKLLRLQRREFFRLETPQAHPLRCKLAAKHQDEIIAFDLPLFDISGGGLSLIGKVEHAEKFALGELFKDCRLEIPGESVLSVNLRIQEILKSELPNGNHQLRLGCEFISLPGTRLTLIERYITRLERERKARETGLV
jgi:c-di-GMP-binding flagellar brake protein YcgR